MDRVVTEDMFTGEEDGGALPDRLELADKFLDGSTFTRVSLKDAILADSQLQAARVDDVNAEGIAFENVNLCRARFHDVNLAGATIDAANLTGVVITNAEIEGMTIDGIAVSDLLARWRDG